MSGRMKRLAIFQPSGVRLNVSSYRPVDATIGVGVVAWRMKMKYEPATAFVGAVDADPQGRVDVATVRARTLDVVVTTLLRSREDVLMARVRVGVRAGPDRCPR